MVQNTNITVYSFKFFFDSTMCFLVWVILVVVIDLIFLILFLVLFFWSKSHNISLKGEMCLFIVNSHHNTSFTIELDV